MNGYDIYKQAMLLLGYGAVLEGAAGDRDFEILFSAIFKQIAADLHLPADSPAAKLTECSAAVLEAAVYGVAMLLAAAHGDSAKNRAFTELYNAKRAAALKKTEAVSDILPKSEVCGQ